MEQAQGTVERALGIEEGGRDGEVVNPPFDARGRRGKESRENVDVSAGIEQASQDGSWWKHVGVEDVHVGRKGVSGRLRKLAGQRGRGGQ